MSTKSDDRFPRIIEQPKLLLGEGIEEQRLFAALARHVGVKGVQVDNYAGKDRLGEVLRALRTRPGFGQLTRLAITRDADEDFAAALQSVRSLLTRHGFSSPERCGEILSGTPDVMIFVLPDGHSAGMLETVCWDSVADDPARGCVDELFQCVEQCASRRPKNMCKARAHAWLATKEVPEYRVAEAAENGYWNFDHAAFGPLIEFLKQI